LPDALNHTDIGGVRIRKGTVAAFVNNARAWPAADGAAAAQLEQDMLEALPALRLLGIFDVFALRDDTLRAWLERHAADASGM
jgi:hypothetical protein